jgi:hypothetical protein
MRTLIVLALLALAASPAGAQNLMAHFRLDELAGTVCVDSTGTGNDGTFTGGYTLGQAPAATGTSTAVLFDGINGHVAIPGTAGLDALSTDLSVSAWIRVTDTNAGWRRVFGNGGSWGAGIWQNQLTFTTNGVMDYFSGGIIQQDTWMHVVWVFDAAFTVTFWVDGNQQAVVTGPGAPGPPWPEWFIASHEGATHMFPGAVDDVQVYAGSLTAEQVTYLHTHPGATLDTVGLAYCFGDGTGGTCPCGNLGGSGEGCANSTGSGAVLEGSGSTSVTVDQLTFTGSNLTPTQPALLFAGLNAVNGGNGVIFGDGIRCAGGSVVRLGVRNADAAGGAEWSQNIAATLGVGAGDVRRFQAWYRDPTLSPCGANFNLSHGVELVFAP